MTIRTTAAMLTPWPDSAICAPVQTTTITASPCQSCIPAVATAGATLAMS